VPTRAAPVARRWRCRSTPGLTRDCTAEVLGVKVKTIRRARQGDWRPSAASVLWVLVDSCRRATTSRPSLVARQRSRTRGADGAERCARACRTVKIFETGCSPREAKPKERKSVRITPEVARAHAPGAAGDALKMAGIIRHHCQAMAHSNASDEQVDVAHQPAFTPQDGLESTALHCGRLINAQHLQSGRGEKRTHPCDIGLHASRVIGPTIALLTVGMATARAVIPTAPPVP
jgi:hypothetical protein